MKICCVYIIKCLKNKRVYIGSTKDYNKRIYNHKIYLKINKHHNKKIQEDYNKYGLESFEFKIISFFDIDINIIEKENEEFLKHFKNDWNNVYNIFSPNNSLISPEYHNFLSEKTSGKNNPMYGKNHSEETIEKWRKTNEKLGTFNNRSCSEETRKLISESKKGKMLGEKNPFYGKNHSEETRKIMSESKKGKSSKNRILTDHQVKEIKYILSEGILKQKEIAEIYGIKVGVISRINTGRGYKNVK